MTLPDPLQCGHPAACAVTLDGKPYTDDTPDDATVVCGHPDCTVEVVGLSPLPPGARQRRQPAPARRVHLPRRVMRALEER